MKKIHIIATDVVLPKNRIDGIEYIACNIFESEGLFEKLGQPDILLHLAWEDGFTHNSMKHIHNLPKHFMFIQSMLDGGIKQLAVMGSMHEVGYFEGEIDEKTATNPLSYYAISKNALREAIDVLIQNYTVTFQWLRAFYIFGDDEGGNSIFSKLIDASKQGKSEFPFTSGRNKYDFIHINELSTQIVCVIGQTEINGIINCCSGVPISLGEMIESYIEDLNLNINLNYGVYPERAYDSPAIWGSTLKIDKIKKENDFINR